MKPKKSVLLLGALMMSTPITAPRAAEATKATDRGVDEHSYAEPDKVRIADLGLDLRVDFDKKQLRGAADLKLDWRDPKYRRLVLDTRDLTIDKVLAKSGSSGWYPQPFKLETADPVFGSKLVIDLKRQHEIVRIRYRTSPKASGLQWLEPSMTAGGKSPFMFSQSQAIHARSWVPLQDTPSVRYTYSAHIETSPKLRALMSADNDANSPRDGDYVFRMAQPIPSYLMAIAVGDLEFAAISERSGVWAEPSTLKAAAHEFADTEKMIAATESLYGPYRWDRYDLLILPPSFPFGGMENPRLSFITPTVIVGDRSLTSLIAHELAHSWSGNLVTNSTWKDIWLNEGFTSYVENRIVEKLYGRELADMEDVISQHGLTTELEELEPPQQRLALGSQAGRDPDEALSAVPYTKGQWFLSFLEHRFGRDTFDAWLRGYFDRHAFKSITTADFEADLRKNLLPKKPDAVTDAELRAWIDGEGIPEFAEAATSKAFDAVDAQRAAFLAGTSPARDLDSKAWGTQSWVRFLEGMPETLSSQQLAELDSMFKFTGTRNPEVAQRWYPLAVRSGYFEARPAIREFLLKIGRRKLVMPIFEALLAGTPDDRAFAKSVFAEAKPGYHPITVGSVEAKIAAAEAKPAATEN